MLYFILFLGKVCATSIKKNILVYNLCNPSINVDQKKIQKLSTLSQTGFPFLPTPYLRSKNTYSSKTAEPLLHTLQQVRGQRCPGRVSLFASAWFPVSLIWTPRSGPHHCDLQEPEPQPRPLTALGDLVGLRVWSTGRARWALWTTALQTTRITNRNQRHKCKDGFMRGDTRLQPA